MMHALPSMSLRAALHTHGLQRALSKAPLLVYASDANHQNPNQILFRPYRLLLEVRRERVGLGDDIVFRRAFDGALAHRLHTLHT